MSKALLTAHAQSVLSIDADDDVQIFAAQVTNGSAGAAFEAFNNQLIRHIQKVVLGQTLTSGTDGREATVLVKCMKMYEWISLNLILGLSHRLYRLWSMLYAL